MTRREYQEASKYLDIIVDATNEYAPRDSTEFAAWFPYLLLGIGSRETEWGLSKHLDQPGPGGTGDFAPRSWEDTPMPPDGRGWGRGLMQIDYAAHEFARTGKWWDAEANIHYGAKVLRGCHLYFVGKRVSGELLRQAALASYNRGQGNIWRDLRHGLHPDERTAGGDYGSDVWRRARWYQAMVRADLRTPFGQSLELEPKPPEAPNRNLYARKTPR